MSTANFWDTEAAPVRAVMDLASFDAEPAVLARIVATFAPDRTRDIAAIAADLGWIDRLETERAADVLADYYGHRITGIYLDNDADDLAEELRASVLTSAQLVASLVTRKAVA